MIGTLLGIDPGLHGALAFFDFEAGSLEVLPMPVRVERRSAKYKSFVDEDALAEMIGARRPGLAYIEDVHAMVRRKGPNGEKQGDGTVAAFSFGEGKGILKGVLAGLRIPRRYVSPVKWKTDLGLIGAAKAASKPRAWKLLPTCQTILKSEGKAEATLIGLWGAFQEGVRAPELANVRPK